MINHTPIDFHNDRLTEIQKLLRELAPHEHGDAINECHICDQGFDEAILIELRRAKALRDALEKAPDPHTCGVSDLAHWTRNYKEPALQVMPRKPLEGETSALSLPGGFPACPWPPATLPTIQATGKAINRAWEQLYPGGVWWCNTHQRQAAGPKGCLNELGGILLPCRVVFAPVEIISEPEPVASLRRQGHSALRIREGELETFDPHPAQSVWREISDPLMRLKAGDLQREAGDDTWTVIPQAWEGKRIGEIKKASVKRIYFRRLISAGLTDTEIVNRLSRHFVTVLHKPDPVGHRETMYYIQRGTLRERAIEIPE